MQCNFNTAGMKIKINGMFFRKTCLSMLNSRSWAAEDQHLKLAANPVATDQYVLCKQQERGAQWMRGWELESHHLRPAQGSFVQGCDNTIEASFFYSFVIGKYFTLLASLHMSYAARFQELHKLHELHDGAIAGDVIDWPAGIVSSRSKAVQAIDPSVGSVPRRAEISKTGL